MATDFRQ